MTDEVLLAAPRRSCLRDGGVAARRAEVGALLGRYLDPVEEQLRTIVDHEVDDLWLRGALGFQLGWRDESFESLPPGAPSAGGKKLRVSLALLSYQAVAAGDATGGVAIEPALAFAAAIELMHNFSLVHDDIEDGDRTRRGRPTMWTLCGVPQAVNLGDCLFGLSFRAVQQVGRQAGTRPVVDELTCALARAGVELTIGQMRDLAFETTPQIDSRRYVEMIRGKTGSLMACATYGGALLGGGPEAARLFKAFGEHLGLAFQVRDDILGIWASEELTGKPAEADIRRRKKSLPIILGLDRAGPDEREELRRIYAGDGPMDDHDVAFVRSVLDRSGVRRAAQHMADAQRDSARAALAAAAGHDRDLDERPGYRALCHLADFAVERDH